ncbi:MAG: hypothetical protein QME79_12940 [Bacillota bacterium]|nr:hypothetical protein [Bacillota bacterium]
MYVIGIEDLILERLTWRPLVTNVLSEARRRLEALRELGPTPEEQA